MEKPELSNNMLSVSKKNIGETMHFSEEKKLQFGKKMPYVALYFIITVFQNNLLLLNYL